MRVSKPGKRIERGNLKSNPALEISEDKIQPTIPPHDPDYDMQYACSRKTGNRSGGHFWNPPAFCEKRILTYWGERWVSVSLCKTCSRYQSKTCPARQVDTDIYDKDYIEDSPQARKARRIAANGLPKRQSAPANDRPRRVS